jgi:hypothetical protein
MAAVAPGEDPGALDAAELAVLDVAERDLLQPKPFLHLWFSCLCAVNERDPRRSMSEADSGDDQLGPQLIIL